MEIKYPNVKESLRNLKKIPKEKLKAFIKHITATKALKYLKNRLKESYLKDITYRDYLAALLIKKLFNYAQIISFLI